MFENHREKSFWIERDFNIVKKFEIGKSYTQFQGIFKQTERI